jgi:hypothetical protein
MGRSLHAAVAGLRHDLARTLELISGNALLLARSSSLDPNAAKLVCNILSASNRGAQMLRQLPPDDEPVGAKKTTSHKGAKATKNSQE